MFTRILVPTDFSETSDAALAHARVLARTFGASLHLLHVVEDQLVTGPLGSEMYVPTTPGMHDLQLAEAVRDLEQGLTADDRGRLRATSAAIVGTAARTIAEYAADNGYDLIVMGTHGRSGLAHMVMGSVAEHVVRSAPCPVLTVRSVPQAVALPVTARAARAGA
jgi:nucleotide-binding universal stress UspA family protein